jgi:hypothetical protein
MVSIRFNNPGLKTNYYEVVVSCHTPEGEIVGINEVLESKLSEIQVASVLAAYVKDSHKLSIRSCDKKPAGHYETFTIDNVVSLISRLKFVEISVVEEPKVVYVKKVITKEL